jgi:hypothetical protein
LSNTIESSGMLFREVQAQSAGHYVGLNTLLTGNAGTAQGLKTRPRYPTIFEYCAVMPVSKHPNVGW